MVTYRRAKHYWHKLFKKAQVFCATRLTFFRVHFLYFFFTIFIFAGLLYIEDSKGRQLPYIDALFFSASAMTLTGLSTYNVSTFSIYQQTLLFILMLLGSQVFVAMGLVQIRRYWFNQKFKEVVMEVRKNSKEAKLTRRKSETFPFAPETVTSIQLSAPVGGNQDERVSEMGQNNSPLENMFQQEGVRQRQVNNTSSDIENNAEQNPYHIWSMEDNEHSQVNDTINTTAGRSIAYAPEVDNQRELARLKRQFLSQQYQERPLGASPHFDNSLERTETTATASSFQLPYKDKMALGGLEYRGLLTLQKILPIYFIGFQLVIGLLIRLWFALSPEMTTNTLTHNENENPAPINPWWFSFFVTISAFNNVGFSLLDQNMVPYQSGAVFLLLCMSLLILVGNTAFALTLRLIIWLLWKCTPKKYGIRKNTFKFLLDHPRRCFTTLFPARTTWLLVIILIVLNVLDLVMFLVLNLNVSDVAVLSWGDRVMDGLFQSFATRTGGFAIFALNDLNAGLLVLYVLMMYIAVYPVAISIRHTNIYEERAVGVYQEKEDSEFEEAPEEHPKENASGVMDTQHEDEHAITASANPLLAPKNNRNPAFFLGLQLRRQLFNDVGWIFIGLFIICSIEADQILKDIDFSVFGVLFEIVSAYANVGISLGHPNVMYSLSGKMSPISKFVMLAIMVIGRHRGLPQAVDRAVLLPSEKLHEKELEDLLLRRTSIANFGNYSASNQNTFHTAPLRRQDSMPLRRVITTS